MRLWRSFMHQDIRTVEDKVAALAARFDLVDAPALAFVRGAVGDLDYAHLVFGTKYRVTADIASNEGDALRRGDRVYFLGAVTDAQGVLTLHFERKGMDVALRFNADAPQEPDTRRYFRNIETTLRGVVFDLSRRRKQLVAARAVLVYLRQQET